jgi:probable rRNA maturation factor
MIEIVNKQRKVQIDTAAFTEFVESAASLIPNAGGRDAAVVFVSDHKIRTLNSKYRNRNTATDVLSFPFGDEDEYLGDVVISVERAGEQASENGLSRDLEIKQLILHGLLHLAGYDHETDDGTMDKLEIKLRKELHISD